MTNINIKQEFEKVIPKNITKALYLCSEAAKEMSLNIFLVGGAVRDIIVGKDNFDTDITVQGNAINFAYHLEKKFPDICKIKEIHEKFKTAKVVFYINNEDIEIDIASTRKESYPYPGSLPNVEEIGCSLYEDVIRRDFTINSMALSLNKETFGDLIDYLGGYEDIKNKQIRILHKKSFTDDPTRIIRALKFRVRFGYELDETTKILQENCLKSGMFDNLCGERIKSELKQTFNINDFQCMKFFLSENIYRLVDTEIKSHYRHCEQNEAIHQPPTSKWIASSQAPLNDVKKHICHKSYETTISEYLNFITPDFIWLIYLGVIFLDFSKEKISGIAEKLYLSNPETAILTEAKTLLIKSELIKKANSNFEIYEFFEGFLPESILIFLIKNLEFKDKINLYLKTLRNIKIVTAGQDLLDSGLKPGPVFGEILRKLLKAKLNGEFSSKEEEILFLKKIL